MNKEEFDNLKIGDKVRLKDSEKEYTVIGTVKNRDRCSVLVEFKSGVLIKNIVLPMPKNICLNVPHSNYDKQFFPFSIDEVDAVVVVKEKTIPFPDGMKCCGCGEHNIYAEPNLDNGKYGCYVCKTTRSWRLK